MDEKKKYGEVAGAADGKDASKVNINSQPAGQSAVVSNTMKTLKQAETTAPSFSSDYDAEIADLYDRIANRPKFRYDAVSDPMWGQYKEQYTESGRQAMRDTQGQAAALTGGYGSSYGQAVGQQQYDEYIRRLNELMPTLRQQAYAEYADEGDKLAQQYAMASQQRDTAYGMYRDQVGDRQYADALAIEQANSRAALGDWAAYREMYGDAAAKVAQIMQNPQAAWAQGIATPEEIKAYTGKYPLGYASGGGGYYSSEKSEKKENPTKLSKEAEQLLEHLSRDDRYYRNGKTVGNAIATAVASGTITDTDADEIEKRLTR